MPEQNGHAEPSLSIRMGHSPGALAVTFLLTVPATAHF